MTTDLLPPKVLTRPRGPQTKTGTDHISVHLKNEKGLAQIFIDSSENRRYGWHAETMNAEPKQEVTIYTDGACQPNPGPGGWGAVLLYPGRKKPVTLKGGEPETTNNRMELRAALEALQSLAEPSRISLFTDSKYLKKGITEWLDLWKRRNWQTQAKTEVKNQDLWRSLAEALARHEVNWRWVKGHAGDRWNEKADKLARACLQRPLPLEDDNAVHIFTAVSFKNSTGSGAWCAILRYRRHVKIIAGPEIDTSGNRLHIRAAIAGLAAIRKPCPIHLYTFSGYLKDGAVSWLPNWIRQNWQTRGATPVRHRDLWQRLHGLLQQYSTNWHVVNKGNPPCVMQEAKILARESAD